MPSAWPSMRRTAWPVSKAWPFHQRSPSDAQDGIRWHLCQQNPAQFDTARFVCKSLPVTL
jgi:hypothetical protein